MDFDMFLDQLKSRLRIEDVISEYVTLRKGSGSRFVGLCPFHSEKTPSFTVFTDDQHFYCFGCGKGGDLITFIRQIENLDYMDALRLLADKAGLDMPQERGDGEYRRRRELVLKINRDAARHFHSNLTPISQSADCPSPPLPGSAWAMRRTAGTTASSTCRGWVIPASR